MQVLLGSFFILLAYVEGVEGPINVLLYLNRLFVLLDIFYTRGQGLWIILLQSVSLENLSWAVSRGFLIDFWG